MTDHSHIGLSFSKCQETDAFNLPKGCTFADGPDRSFWIRHFRPADGIDPVIEKDGERGDVGPMSTT